MPIHTLYKFLLRRPTMLLYKCVIDLGVLSIVDGPTHVRTSMVVLSLGPISELNSVIKLKLTLYERD